jgi:hypothetical protein
MNEVKEGIKMKRCLAQIFFVAAVATFSSGVARASDCVSMDIEQGDYAPETATKKADYAIAAVSDPGYLSKDPTCVAANIRYLGLAHVRKAIPALVGLLGYRIAPRPFRKPTNFELYPAISALSNIGETSVPALIGLLATKDTGALERVNAIDAFMSIHRENLDKGLQTLKLASEKETDTLRASRLREATLDARSRWCRFSPCKE